MAQQKALLLAAAKGALAVDTIPVPRPGLGEILIKVQAVALNPVDWMIQAYGIFIDKFPSVIGYDLSGTVEELGEGVTGFAKGDRVLTEAAVGVSEHSAFQQYALGNAEVTAKIPGNVSFEQAATIPLCLATAAVGLYNTTSGIALASPWEDAGRDKYKDKPFFVFSGASSVGQFVIQLAKLSGFNPIIATASLHNAAYLKGIGATHVIDRNFPIDTIRAEVATITPAPIEVVYDVVSSKETQNLGYDLLSPEGALVLVTQKDSVEEAKKGGNKRIAHTWGDVNRPQYRALGVSLYSKLTALLEQGLIKPNRVELLPNGLHGIVGGLEKLKQGVSNIKLVVRPQETA